MTPPRILSPSFYDRPPQVVAEDLLGKLLIRRIGNQYAIGRIVETEAYLATHDPASHSFIGRTKRNASMFKKAGTAYVHRMRHHTLLNAVTEPEGVGSGVLLRGIEPLVGLQLLGGYDADTPAKLLANGPGKVGRAFHITHRMDGISLTDPEGELFIAEDLESEPGVVVTTTRIGISKGADMLLRFYLEGNTHVSRYVKKKRQ